MKAVIRALLFAVFFSIGASAFSISILCDELLQYYHNRELLRLAEGSLEQLKTLDADYDALLSRLEKDPGILKHLAPATLGTEPADANAVYPKASARQLALSLQELAEQSDGQVEDSSVPAWLSRCSRRPQRTALFLSGAFLILISFVWFGQPCHKGPPAY